MTDSGSLVTPLGRAVWCLLCERLYLGMKPITMVGRHSSVLNLEQDAVITVTRGGIVDVNGQRPSSPASGDGQDGAGSEFRAQFLSGQVMTLKVVIREGTYISGLTCIRQAAT